MYNIILEEEEMETYCGTLHKGDVLETVFYDDISELKRYLIINYAMDDIKVSYKRVGD